MNWVKIFNVVIFIGIVISLTISSIALRKISDHDELIDKVQNNLHETISDVAVLHEEIRVDKIHKEVTDKQIEQLIANDDELKVRVEELEKRKVKK